jgi:hypothetical protein
MMTKNQKYIVIGSIAALGAYWYFNRSPQTSALQNSAVDSPRNRAIAALTNAMNMGKIDQAGVDAEIAAMSQGNITPDAVIAAVATW